MDWIGDPLSSYPLSPHPFISKPLSLNWRFFIHFNTKHPLLSSRFIRQAFNTVVDRKWVCKNLCKDSTSMLTFFDSTPDLTFRSFQDHDLKKGQKLFIQGLKELKVDKKQFPPLSFIYPEIEELKVIACYLKKVWEEAFGISIRLEEHPWTKFFQKLEQGEHHLSGLFRNLYPHDPLVFFQTFSGNHRNFSHWSHLRYDQTLEKAKQAMSIEKLRFFINQLDKIMVEEAPVFPLFDTPYRHITSPHLKNYALTPFGSLDFRFSFIENLFPFTDLHQFVISMQQNRDETIKRKVSRLIPDSTPLILRKQNLLFLQAYKKENRFFRMDISKITSSQNKHFRSKKFP